MDSSIFKLGIPTARPHHVLNPIHQLTADPVECTRQQPHGEQDQGRHCEIICLSRFRARETLQFCLLVSLIPNSRGLRSCGLVLRHINNVLDYMEDLEEQ